MVYSICRSFLGCFSISTLAFFDRIIQALNAIIDMFGIAFGVFSIFRIDGMRFRMFGMLGNRFAISRSGRSFSVLYGVHQMAFPGYRTQ